MMKDKVLIKKCEDPRHAAVPEKPWYDDDDDEEPGRILSNEEYADQLRKRADIFIVEKDTRLRNLELICLLLALVSGIYLSTCEIVEVADDFFEKGSFQRPITIVDPLPESLNKEERKEKKEDFKTEKRKLKQNKHAGAGGNRGGGGDPRARVTRKGVLGILFDQIKGKTVASADIFGKGGFASGIDAILAGLGGLKSGGSGGVGRKGAAGIGYGAGYGSGFGGGSQ